MCLFFAVCGLWRHLQHFVIIAGGKGSLQDDVPDNLVSVRGLFSNISEMNTWTVLINAWCSYLQTRNPCTNACLYIHTVTLSIITHRWCSSLPAWAQFICSAVGFPVLASEANMINHSTPPPPPTVFFLAHFSMQNNYCLCAGLGEEEVKGRELSDNSEMQAKVVVLDTFPPCLTFKNVYYLCAWRLHRLFKLIWWGNSQIIFLHCIQKSKMVNTAGVTGEWWGWIQSLFGVWFL